MKSSLLQNIDLAPQLKAYPAAISEMLLELFTAVIAEIPNKYIYSILLLGSTSRGELSYIETNDSLDIFSDFEFVVIEKSKIPSENLHAMQHSLKELERVWQIKSPMFHIDFGISSINKFKITPRTFWSFEVKSTAIVIYGEDARKLLPKVTLENIDFGSLNELIFVSLWNMLLQISPRMLAEKDNDYTRFVIQQAYARNILDVISILLPNKGILSAGYENRLRQFKKTSISESWNEDTFKIEAATTYKLHPQKTSFSQINFQGPFIDGYKKLLSDLTGENFGEGGLSKIKSELFKEGTVRRLRRHYLEVKLFIKYYKCNFRKISLIFGDKIKIGITQILFDLHLASDLRLSQKKRLNHLISAEICFKIISNNFVAICKDDGDFDDRWESLRLALVDFMMPWFYGRSTVEKQEILDRINWREQ